MNISKLTKVALVALFAGICTGVAGADTNEELQARLEAAEARIAELSASDSDNWLNDRRAEETRKLVHDVLADADNRASFQGNGSPVTVNVHGFVQTRFDYSGGGDTDANHGFSVPRSRLILSGDIYDFGYKVSGQWSDGGDFELKDAYGTGQLGGLDFQFGQFKAPFMKEVLVSRTDTLAADRSIVSYTFGQGRSQGIQFGKDFGALTLRGAYTDGFATANGAGIQNGYALTARADYDVTSWWSLGAAVSWNDLVDSNYTTYTVDTGVNVGALDITAAYIGVNRDAGDDWATTLTASYQCMDNLEGFVAYEFGRLEGATADLSVATVGVNYMINPNVKWTTDVGYAMNDIDSGWDVASTGWNASAAEGEYLVRTQLQIQF